MASTLSLRQPLKRLIVSSTTHLLRHPPSPAPSAAPLSSSSRLFATKAPSSPCQFFPDVPYDVDVEPVIENNQSMVPASHGEELAPYFLIETDDAMYLRVNLAGVSKDGVEVTVAPPDKLTVTGKRMPDPDTMERGLKITFEFRVPEEFFKTDQITTVMKHGVLSIAVPKKVRGAAVADYFRSIED